MIQNSITKHNSSDINHSHALKSKKLCLIKIFKNKNPYERPSSKKYTKTQIQHVDQGKFQYDIKTQRLVEDQQLQETNYRRLSQIRVKTQANRKTKKPINIFQNDYADCLKNGYTNAYQETIKLKNTVKQNDPFQGPKFYSQRSPKIHINQEQPLKRIEFKQEIYKQDKNPKLVKFKVSLKRNSFNAVQDAKSIYEKKNHPSRIMITQLKTEMSQPYQSSSHSQEVTQFLDAKRTLSLHQSSGFDPRKEITKKFSFHVPRLSEQTNTYKSIKIFERKKMLLGQIESQKDIQQKYGNRILQFSLRDRYKQIANKNDFMINLKGEIRKSKLERTYKNKFITDIEQGKYDRNFSFKQKNIPLKLKGNFKKVNFYQQ